MPKRAEAEWIEILVRGAEDNPTLLDLSSFVYDFNLAYEISRLAVDPAYQDFHFTSAAIYRRGRPLKNQDRLLVDRVRFGSPWEIITVVVAAPAAIAAMWGLVKHSSTPP